MENGEIAEMAGRYVGRRVRVNRMVPSAAIIDPVTYRAIDVPFSAEGIVEGWMYVWGEGLRLAITGYGEVDEHEVELLEAFDYGVPVH